jgi:D-lactate dehydrogenase
MLTADNSAFIAALKSIIGPRHVLTKDSETRRYRTGFRFGQGKALAVVRPQTLVEQWKVLQACVAANKIVIMQAANTGLTGGSTPDGRDYDRDIVIVSTLRMNQVQLIDGGRQVIAFPGATLYQLEKKLKPLDREPHSVIGSSCIGASVMGGICNNSGGALIQRGPAYTEMALYARIDKAGGIELVNHLGVRLGNDPETMLNRLESRSYADADVEHDTGRHCRDHDYAAHIREIDAASPARFNADPRKLFEASGSAGKIMLFAVRLDTFPKNVTTKVFYIGTNDPAELTAIRRHILARFSYIPVAGEYIHRTAFDIAERYGKDTFLVIQKLGTDFLPGLFAAKAAFDDFAGRLGLSGYLSDRLMQLASCLFPSHLPRRMKTYRDKYEHHLMLRMAGLGIEEARAYFSSLFPTSHGNVFECSDSEGAAAFLHRFAVAGAAVRYRAVHAREVSDIVALDIALRRDDRAWFEALPPKIEEAITQKLYYGHFFCHVFHQDYIIKNGHDPLAIEHAMWKLLDARGAEYPAEHNVGHLYPAKPPLAQFYRQLDPTNSFNPGIGQTSKQAGWAAQ